MQGQRTRGAKREGLLPADTSNSRAGDASGIFVSPGCDGIHSSLTRLKLGDVTHHRRSEEA